MPGVPHPRQTTEQVTYVFSQPHGKLLFYAILITALVILFLWQSYVKYIHTQEPGKYCWLCGGDKKKNLCFMGATHFTKEDHNDFDDHMVA